MKVPFLELVFTFHLIAVEAQTTSFEAVTSLSGEKLCAIAEPMKVELNVRSVIRCGTICSANEFCQMYGYKSVLNECELYDSAAPQAYSQVPGCSSYILQSESCFLTAREQKTLISLPSGACIKRLRLYASTRLLRSSSVQLLFTSISHIETI